MLRAGEDMAAHALAVPRKQRQHVLQLIPEAVCASSLLESRAGAHTAVQHLLYKETVYQFVQGPIAGAQ